MTQLTVELPQPVLESLKRKARLGRRRIADQLVETLTTALKQDSPPSSNGKSILDGMQFLTDQELMKMVRSNKGRKLSRELSELRELAVTRRLNKVERLRQQELLDAVDRCILIRAQALLLLKEHGRELPSGLQRE